MGIGECEETNIIIPSVVNGKLVTKIADGAFMGHSDILSVKISKNITSIGANAFNGCASLDTIYFDGSDYEWTLIEKGENWNQNAGKCEMRYSEINDDWELEGAPIG